MTEVKSKRKGNNERKRKRKQRKIDGQNERKRKKKFYSIAIVSHILNDVIHDKRVRIDKNTNAESKYIFFLLFSFLFHLSFSILIRVFAHSRGDPK